MRPFRFGIEISKLHPKTWIDDLKFIEDVGYSSILFTDHFGPQWEPTAAMSMAAARTERLHVGTMVYCVDFRHPAVMARAVATVHLLSGGRVEFGIGAGWLRADYEQSGIPFDGPATRIQRMEEAIRVIRGMWTETKSSFDGRHYTVRNISRALDLKRLGPPPILVGGGGKRILSVAGRRADIVSMIPSIPEGRFTKNFVKQALLDQYHKKIGWVSDAAEKAGRDPDELEYSVCTFHTEVTDDPDPVYEKLAKRWQISKGEVESIPVYFIGTAEEICEKIKWFREETGVNYFVLGLPSLEEIRQFGTHVVTPLNGR